MNSLFKVIFDFNVDYTVDQSIFNIYKSVTNTLASSRRKLRTDEIFITLSNNSNVYYIKILTNDGIYFLPKYWFEYFIKTGRINQFFENHE